MGGAGGPQIVEVQKFVHKENKELMKQMEEKLEQEKL
jgi:hypothetical protein